MYNKQLGLISENKVILTYTEKNKKVLDLNFNPTEKNVSDLMGNVKKVCSSYQLLKLYLPGTVYDGALGVFYVLSYQ